MPGKISASEAAAHLETLVGRFRPLMRGLIGPSIEETMKAPLTPEESGDIDRGVTALVVMATYDEKVRRGEIDGKRLEAVAKAIEDHINSGAPLDPELASEWGQALKQVSASGMPEATEEEIEAAIAEETERISRHFVTSWLKLLKDTAKCGHLNPHELDEAMLPAADRPAADAFLGQFVHYFTPAQGRKMLSDVRAGLPKGEPIPLDAMAVLLEYYDLRLEL